MKRLGWMCGLLVLWSSAVYAREVNVVLTDQQLVKGELIGISDGLLFIKTPENRAEQIELSRVKGVFDAGTGQAVVLDAPAAAMAESPAVPPAAPAATAPAAEVSGIAAPPTPAKTLLFLYGTLDSGWVGYLPCQPLEGVYRPGAAYVNGMQPYDTAWGMGLGMEYRVIENLAGSFEFGINRWDKLLAKANGYGVGDWVWEQTAYADAIVGPFPMDVKYYMDTTSLRLGAKYYPWTGFFQPYIGIALGLYAWQATIGNREQEKKYSEISSGTEVSPTLQIGVNFVWEDLAIRVFGDFASPVGHPKFENLFRTGWTFESASGEHLQGPYRFGIAVGMGL